MQVSGVRRKAISFCLYLAVVSAFAQLSVSRAFADDCSDSASTADSACKDPTSTAGLTQDQVTAINTCQSNCPALGGGAGSDSSAAACTQNCVQSNTSAKVGACTTMTGSCQDKCQSMITSLQSQLATASAAQKPAIQKQISTAQSKGQACKALQANTSTAGMAQMMQAAAAMLQALASLEAMSQTSPTATPEDCTNPSFALTNQVCICSTPGSVAYAPKSTICNNTSQAGAGPMMDAQTGPMTPTDSGGNIGTGDNGMNASVSAPVKGQGGTTPEAGGGGGGGGGPTGGGRLGNGNPDPTGVAPSNVDKSVITGQAGGSGGGAPGGGGGGVGALSGHTGSGGGVGAFDIGKFLPAKKDYKNRGLASVGFQAKDGITGAMGPSIWEKVANQYQQQKAKQNLILDK